MSSATLLLKPLRSITATLSKQLKVSNSKWYVQLFFPHSSFFFPSVFLLFRWTITDFPSLQIRPEGSHLKHIEAILIKHVSLYTQRLLNLDISNRYL